MYSFFGTIIFFDRPGINTGIPGGTVKLEQSPSEHDHTEGSRYWKNLVSIIISGCPDMDHQIPASLGKNVHHEILQLPHP